MQKKLTITVDEQVETLVRPHVVEQDLWAPPTERWQLTKPAKRKLTSGPRPRS